MQLVVSMTSCSLLLAHTHLLESIVNTQFKTNLARLAPEASYERLSKSIVEIWDDSVTPAAIRPAVVQSFTEAIRYGYVIGSYLSRPPIRLD